MKKAYRICVRVFVGASVLLVAAVVASVVVLRSLDLNEYTDLITEKTKEATGRDLVIAGDLALEMSLSPSFTVEGVTVSNAQWGRAGDMLRVDEFAMEIALIPLLIGDVEIKRVILTGVDVVLETNADGIGNWMPDDHQTGRGADDDSRTPGGLPVVHSVRLADVNVTYVDGVNARQYSLRIENLDVRADGIDSPLQIAARAIFNSETFALDGTLGSIRALDDNRTFPVNVTMNALGATVKLDGVIDNPRGTWGSGPEVNLGIHADAGDVAHVIGRAMTLAGLQEQRVLPPNAIKLTGTIHHEDDGYGIDGLALTLGSSDLTGRIDLRTDGKVPVLRADLRSDQFLLGDIQPARDGRDAAPATGGDDGRVFADDPLPLDSLKAVNAKVTFAGKTVVANNVTLGNVDVVVDLKNGHLRIPGFSLDLGGGRLSGDAGLNGAGRSATVALNVDGNDIDYGRVLKEMADQETLQGTLDMDVNIRGSGQSVRALMAGLNGNLRVVSEQGRVNSGALELLAGPLSALLGGGDANDLRCAVADFHIVDGIATSRATIFETGGLSVIGTGDIDLREEKLALYFDPRARSVGLMSAAEVGIIVSGTLKEPSIAVDAAGAAMGAASLAAGVVTGGMSLLLGSLLDTAGSATDDTDYCALALAGKPLQSAGGKTNAASEESRSEPQAPQELGGEGVINDLMNNLFGN